MSAVLEKPPVPKKSTKRRAPAIAQNLAEALGDFVGCNVDSGLPADAARRHKHYFHAAIQKKHSR